MNTHIKQILDIFTEISKIPRASKKEEKIREWLISFAKEHDIEFKADTVGNLVMYIPASEGYEDKEGYILQGHMDMVCQKTESSIHDFDKDKIVPIIDGDVISAKDTTLGSDNGIGLALMLYVATSDEIKHPKLELLFTVDEETGLTGASGLDPKILSLNRLINLDSEDDGEITIGSACSQDCIINRIYELEDGVGTCFNVKLGGGLGGHSGTDIHRNRSNMIVIFFGLLDKIINKFETKLVSINIGTARNAIPFNGVSKLNIHGATEKDIQDIIDDYVEELKKKFPKENIEISINSEELKSKCISFELTKNLVDFVGKIPSGVVSMSKNVEGLVQTSNNLGIIKLDDGNLELITMTRSFNEGDLTHVTDEFAKLASSFGFQCEKKKISLGWEPDIKSDLLKDVIDSYTDMFGKDPKVGAIHAGLECGVIKSKFQNMDAVSIGPTITGAHSTSEKIYISSIEKVFNWLKAILAK